MGQTQYDLENHNFEGDVKLFKDPSQDAWRLFFQDSAPTEKVALNAIWVDTDATGGTWFYRNSSSTPSSPSWSSIV